MNGAAGAIGAPPLRAALRRPELRRVVVAFGLAVTAEWALWIGLLVYAYDRGGSTAAGLVSIGLLLPAMVVAPSGGAVADGARPNRVLTVVFVVQAASLAVAAATAGLGWSIPLVVASTTPAVLAITYVRPTCAVVVPGLVTNPGELTAANVLIGWWESASVLGGPLLAGGRSEERRVGKECRL